MDQRTSASGAVGLRQRNHEQRRSAILAAASRTFAEKGYAAASTQEIAAQAGLAHGTIFRYAPSKAELFLTVYNGEFAARLEELEAAVTAEGESGAPERAEELIVDGLLGWLERHGANARVYQREILHGPPASVAVNDARALVERCVALIAMHIAGGERHVTAPAVSLARLFFVGSQLDPNELLPQSVGSHALTDHEVSPRQRLTTDLRLLGIGYRARDASSANLHPSGSQTTGHQPVSPEQTPTGKKT